MIQSVRDLYRVSGRLNRAEWWIQNLVLVGIWFILILSASILGDFTRSTDLHEVALLGVMAVSYIYGIGAIVAQFCLSIRRFHDRDKTGWWVAVPWLVLAGLDLHRLGLDILSLGFGVTLPELALVAVKVALALWFLVELGFIRGTAGPNRFGPDPLAMPAEAD